MNISAEAKEQLIKYFEGLSLKAYPDPASGGVPWTIGYGHTEGVKKGDVCTLDEANAFLDQDLTEHERVVNRFVIKPLNQFQFDAVVSFVFNLGETKFRGSTLFGKLNAGKFDEAAKEFNKWVYGGGKVMKGLVRRRQAETNWFNRSK